MRTIRIWAPVAHMVEIIINGEELQMRPDNYGFWQLDVAIGDDSPLYSCKIDGKGPFPPPVSHFLPEGVHGRSQLWQDSFIWTDKDWKAPSLENAVIYELHTGTFTPEGTFAAIHQRLDHLVDLGVTHVQLMPVAAFPGKHGWGYDGVGLYSPHCHYGNPIELKRLVEACHARGLAIILDVVYNHLGPDGNYLGHFGPYFSGRYHTPWGEAVNFDSAFCDQVRRFIIENALMWLRDFHFDGLRLDAVNQIYDFSVTHILEELQAQVNKLTLETGKDFILIAESDQNDPRLVKPFKSGGYGLSAQYLDDFHHALHVMLTGEKHGYYQDFCGAADLQKCLKKGFVYDGQYSRFRKRNHGRVAEKIPLWRYVVFAQNHDQVGNRAFGERLCHIIPCEYCQIAAALLFMSPFVPLIFQGEEWASSSPFLYFTDHTDSKLANAVRRGRIREFPEYRDFKAKIPDPQSQQTFLKSVLAWEEIHNAPHDEMFAWYRRLISLRKEFIADIRAKKRRFMIVDKDLKLYIYNFGRLQMFINGGPGPGRFKIANLSKLKLLLQNRSFEKTANTLCLPAGAVVLFQNSCR